MNEKGYITEEERVKCQKVVEAFAELYELTDTVVVDAGRYGFVKLQYYNESNEFETMTTYTGSRELFEELWEDWFEEQVLTAVSGTPLEELDCEEIFAQLPKEKQEATMAKKAYFARCCEVGGC